MPLDKLRGLHRLGSGSVNTVQFDNISSGSAAASWTENAKNHYRFTAGATVELKISSETYYTRRDRNIKKTIGNVNKNDKIDFLVAGGGGGGGTGYNPYGGGGGGGGGGVKAYFPQVQGGLNSPSQLTLVSQNWIVGGYNLTNTNPFTDPTIRPVSMPMTIGGGGGPDASGGPSSIGLPTIFKDTYNPTFSMSVSGGGSGYYASNGQPGGSGGGGSGWVSGAPGPSVVGEGNPGGAGGNSGNGAQGGAGGGGGGKSGGGNNGTGSGGIGGGSMQVNFAPGTIYYGAGGGGAGRPGFNLGPPQAIQPYSPASDASGGTGAGNAPGGPAPQPACGGGGGYGNGSSGGTGGNGTVVVAFSG